MQIPIFIAEASKGRRLTLGYGREVWESGNAGEKYLTKGICIAGSSFRKGELRMEQKVNRIDFRLGRFGKLAPLLAAAAMILWAAFSQSNVNGYVLAFFAALVTGVLFAKDEKAYGEALVYGLSKPIFGVIVMAVILAAVSGKLISASGAVQTIAAYVVAAGFTGKLFVAASFLITCLLAFATGTSVGTYLS